MEGVAAVEWVVFGNDACDCWEICHGNEGPFWEESELRECRGAMKEDKKPLLMCKHNAAAFLSSFALLIGYNISLFRKKSKLFRGEDLKKYGKPPKI